MERGKGSGEGEGREGRSGERRRGGWRGEKGVVREKVGWGEGTEEWGKEKGRTVDWKKVDRRK